jgi:hypothetical protein
MKKYLILMFAFLGFATFSQTVVQMKGSTGATSDTVTNAGTEYVTIQAGSNTSVITFQFVGTKISGTVAGTVTLQSSLDGVNYTDVDASLTTVDSYTNTNVTTNTYLTTVSRPAFMWYRFKVVGTGTMVQSFKGYVLSKNEY